MKVTFDHKKLNKILKKTKSVAKVAKVESDPENHVRFFTKDNYLKIETLHEGHTFLIDIEHEIIEEGDIYLDKNILKDILGNFSEKRVSLSYSGGSCVEISSVGGEANKTITTPVVESPNFNTIQMYGNTEGYVAVEESVFVEMIKSLYIDLTMANSMSSVFDKVLIDFDTNYLSLVSATPHVMTFLKTPRSQGVNQTKMEAIVDYSILQKFSTILPKTKGSILKIKKENGCLFFKSDTLGLILCCALDEKDHNCRPFYKVDHYLRSFSAIQSYDFVVNRKALVSQLDVLRKMCEKFDMPRVQITIETETTPTLSLSLDEKIKNTAVFGKLPIIMKQKWGCATSFFCVNASILYTLLSSVDSETVNIHFSSEQERPLRISTKTNLGASYNCFLMKMYTPNIEHNS